MVLLHCAVIFRAVIYHTRYRTFLLGSATQELPGFPVVSIYRKHSTDLNCFRFHKLLICTDNTCCRALRTSNFAARIGQQHIRALLFGLRPWQNLLCFPILPMLPMILIITNFPVVSISIYSSYLIMIFFCC